MPKPKFQMPATTVKELAESTHRVYVLRLNRLAVAGFETVDDLLKDPKGVLKAIDEYVGPEDTDASRQSRRYFLSAIFYVLPADYLAKKNPYYKAFQKAKQSYGKKLTKDGKYV